MISIATLFDKNHLLKALALHESAMKFVPDARFFILCLDEESSSLLLSLKLPNTEIMRVENINDSELINIRNTRDRASFAFTAKSAWLSFLIKSGRIPQHELLIWADADIFFMSETKHFLSETKKYSISITPHAFPKNRREKASKVGRYNAGFIIFRNDEEARKCLSEWRAECIEWCFNKQENGKLGDQTYLDQWQKKYKNVYDIPNKGVNLGTWNITQYKIKEISDKSFTVDGESLMCYHFHGLQTFPKNSEQIAAYPVNVFHKAIYRLYIEALNKHLQEIQKNSPDWKAGFSPKLSLLKLIKQKIFRVIHS